MARTPNQARPEELLEAIAAYVAENGLSDLSLRPLARAVGSSPRVLLYYFGSREKLIAKVFEVARQRQQNWVRAMQGATLHEACLQIWRRMTRPAELPWFQLFFEAYGLAIRQPDAHNEFLRHALEDWISKIAQILEPSGCSREDAQSLATALLAGFRGFMLDYCATRERARVERAFVFWARALEAEIGKSLGAPK